jgi:hypothetical protein
MLQNAAYCLGVTAAQVRADFYFCHEPQAAKRRLKVTERKYALIFGVSRQRR